MIQFQVITITNDIERYPQFREDSEEFCHLIEFIDDEVETFIVDERDDGFWTADEFFDCTRITTFVVDSMEAP